VKVEFSWTASPQWLKPKLFGPDAALKGRSSSLCTRFLVISSTLASCPSGICVFSRSALADNACPPRKSDSFTGKKRGCRVSMRSRQPKNCEPRFGPSCNYDKVTLVTLQLQPGPSSTAVAGLFDSWVVWVGTESVGHRPRREPVGRQLQRMCPLVLPSGSRS